jgi:DNA topoisomerase IA
VPLATVELQRRASRFFHMSGDVIMKVAEELYVKGYISYPRCVPALACTRFYGHAPVF